MWFNVLLNGAAHGCELDEQPAAGTTALLGDVLARVESVTTGADDQPLIIARSLEIGPQVAAFVIDVGTGERLHRSVSPRHVGALIARLLAERSLASTALATRLIDATQLPTQTTDVIVAIGEDEALLRAIEAIRTETGQLGDTLANLKDALQAKLDAEQ